MLLFQHVFGKQAKRLAGGIRKVPGITHPITDKIIIGPVISMPGASAGLKGRQVTRVGLADGTISRKEAHARNG
jgi:hypothetical protein